MNIKLFNDDIETLRPVMELWRSTVDFDKFGIIADSPDKYLTELNLLARNDNSDLLVLYDNDIPVGYIGLQYFESPFSNQRIANEHFMYVVPEKRGLASMRLIKDAKILAKLKGCSHIIFNASNLASDLHDKLCRVYEKIGFAKFETCFITKLE